MHTAGKLARRYGLSRSTLLYYHRIGLAGAERAQRGQLPRLLDTDRERLERILAYRDAGVPIEVIHTCSPRTRAAGAIPGAPAVRAQHRDRPTACAAARHRPTARRRAGVARQPNLGQGRLGRSSRRPAFPEAEMDLWHVEFERRAPEAHQDFLEALGILLAEIVTIRQRSAAAITLPA